MGNVRRAMSLPCGLAAAHEVLGETDAGADTFLERRSAGTVLAVIKRQIELCADGAERQKLTEAESAVDAAFNEFEHDTPIGSMLAEIAASFRASRARASSPFRATMNCCLGKRRICTDDEQGEQIKKRHRERLHPPRRRCRRSTRSLPASKAVAAAIPGSALSSSHPRAMRSPFLLGRKWLPEEIIVLADREFVDRLGVTYAALASHPDLSGAGQDWQPACQCGGRGKDRGARA